MSVGIILLNPKSNSGISNNSLKDFIAMSSTKIIPYAKTEIIAILFLVVLKIPFFVSSLKKYHKATTLNTASIKMAK